MDAATPGSGPPPESDLLVCLAAIGRALEAEFQPRAFLDDLSTGLRRLVPHDRLGIAYLAANGRTFSVFADHGAPGFLPLTDRYATGLERPARFPVADSPLAAVFDGNVLCASHLQVDAHCVDHAEAVQAAGLQSAVFVPLLSGSRVIGALGAASRVEDAYGAVQVEGLRGVGRLIGPFIETIVLLYRERRLRHHVELLKGITQLLGTTLDVRQILAVLGEAIRPSLDFDTMGVILFEPGSPEFMLFGTVGEPPDPSVARLSTRDYSVAEAVRAGRPVRVDETATELDRRYAGDRALLAVGLHSCLWVPMHFGDEVGGALLFGKHEAYWYDDVDVEVATVVAIRMVLGIQHQRLAEEQRRLASVERRARALEQSLKSARSELHQRYGFEQIIGQSPILREALTRGAQVARTEATVLITGDSGTGKELVARAIHHASPRARRARSSRSTARRFPTPSWSPSCSATRGAPSPARTDRSPGRFELADGGTLFLDEVGELLCRASRSSSSACSRSGSTSGSGGTATLKADVRLIAATNRDLMAEIAAGRFRSDLFYRLTVFNVHLPPLRERGDDVLLLADYFIRSLAAKMGKADVTLSRDAREMLSGTRGRATSASCRTPSSGA